MPRDWECQGRGGTSCSSGAESVNRTASFAAPSKRREISSLTRSIFEITEMEATDLNFEFAFPQCLIEDGSGEKGFEKLEQHSVFHVEREHPQSSPRKFVCF